MFSLSSELIFSFTPVKEQISRSLCIVYVSEWYCSFSFFLRRCRSPNVHVKSYGKKYWKSHSLSLYLIMFTFMIDLVQFVYTINPSFHLPIVSKLSIFSRRYLLSFTLFLFHVLMFHQEWWNEKSDDKNGFLMENWKPLIPRVNLVLLIPLSVQSLWD